MMPSLERMGRAVLENRRAEHFIVNPNVAVQLMDYLTPLWRHDMRRVFDPDPDNDKMTIFGKNLLVCPDLRDGDFFPVYMSSLRNILQQLEQ